MQPRAGAQTGQCYLGVRRQRVAPRFVATMDLREAIGVCDRNIICACRQKSPDTDRALGVAQYRFSLLRVGERLRQPCNRSDILDARPRSTWRSARLQARSGNENNLQRTRNRHIEGCSRRELAGGQKCRSDSRPASRDTPHHRRHGEQQSYPELNAGVPSFRLPTATSAGRMTTPSTTIS